MDPDGAEQGADDDRAAREVHLSQSFGGLWFGRITLDPVSGDIVDTTLRSIEAELFDADWAEAKARARPRARQCSTCGAPPPSAGPTPSSRWPPAPAPPPQVGAAPPRSSRWWSGSRPSVGPILELFNRTVLTPGTAAAHLTEADVERIVFDGPSRVLDVGAQRRFFTGALRRAIEIRDRTCFHPSCDEVPDRPEIDHIHEACQRRRDHPDQRPPRLRASTTAGPTSTPTPTTTPTQPRPSAEHEGRPSFTTVFTVADGAPASARHELRRRIRRRAAWS